MDNAREESFFKFEILIKSFEAFQRIKSIILLLVTVIISRAILYGFTNLSSNFNSHLDFGAAKFTMFTGEVISGVIFLIGYTATGKILMEYAKNKSSIPVMDSVIFSLFSFYRLIISGVILAIIPIVVAIVALIYFLIAKIPDLGKLLAFIGIPAFTIIFTIIFFVIALIGFMIVPMVFQGNNIKEILIKAFKIYKKHATLIFGYFIFIYVVTFIVGVLFIILSLVSLTLTNRILMVTKPDYLYNNMLGGLGNPTMGMLGGLGNPMMGMFGSLQYLEIFGRFISFGVSIVYMLIFSILSVYMLLGQNYIYLDIASNMNFDDVDAQFKEMTYKVRSNIDKYKEKAASMSSKNIAPTDNQANQTPRASAQSGGAGDTGTGVKLCPNCGAKNPADAKFCENCGNKLN
jgi:hypothetical protein